MVTKDNIIIQCKDLIEELSLDYLSLEKQEELISDMSSIVYDRVILRILGMLTEEEAMKLTKFIEERREEEAGDFLAEKIPEFDNILKRELLDFQQEIVQVVR